MSINQPSSFSYETVQDYIASLVRIDNAPLIQHIEQSTHAHFPSQAHMLVGTSGGNFLSLLVQLLQPQVVVELGTFTGYSAGFLAEHLPVGATLFSVEIKPAHLDLAKQHLATHPKSHQIEWVLQDATEFLSSFDRHIDLAFVDANKQSYETHYTLIKQRMSRQGVIIVDNAFFHGEVFQTDKGKIAAAIHDFNVHIAQDPEVVASLLPIRDGMWIVTLKNKK